MVLKQSTLTSVVCIKLVVVLLALGRVYTVQVAARGSVEQTFNVGDEDFEQNNNSVQHSIPHLFNQQ